MSKKHFLKGPDQMARRVRGLLRHAEVNSSIILMPKEVKTGYRGYEYRRLYSGRSGPNLSESYKAGPDWRVAAEREQTIW